MAAPIWITQPGDLGVISELEYYTLSLDAYDPDASQLTFRLTSGHLPRGMSLTNRGTIQGIPIRGRVDFSGVPYNVDKNTTSSFTIRATSVEGIVTDRSFTITVTGARPPEILTTGPSLGYYYDGVYFSKQLVASEQDPTSVTEWSISSGALPKGVTLDSTTGVLSGFIYPVERTAAVNFGFDGEPFDQYLYGAVSNSINKNYQFTVLAKNNRGYDAKTYTIFVYSKSSFLASNDEMTADLDSEIITSDLDNKRNPVIVDFMDTDLGTYVSDNYYHHKFNGYDFDGEPITYEMAAGGDVGFDNANFDTVNFDKGDDIMVPTLTLDSGTGWLYGLVDPQPAVTQDYSFGVRVYKTNDTDYKSDWITYHITILASDQTTITWETDSNLGAIAGGQVSEFSLSTVNTLGHTVYYRFKSGEYNRLPQGLRLSANVEYTDNGDGSITSTCNITGRNTFNYFSLDGGATTFDQGTLLTTAQPTTFDTVWRFTVEAYDLEGDILIAREFYINTTVVDTKPYENLYLAARPAIHERDSFEILRQDTEVIPSELIYRPTDPYFGVAPDIRFLLANGLNPSTALAYKQNMWLNHATRRLFFGNIKTAQVLNSDNSVRYEVVYVDVIDTYENAEGVTVSKVVDSSNKITEQLTVDQSVYDASQVFITGDEATEGRDYPASLDNMRTQINNTIGVSNSNTLPAWMSSKQSTGRSLGMVYAVPLVYTVPNASNKIAYRIRDKYPNLFEQIEFLVDQYIWDCNLSSNYDQTNQRYYTSNETTFDKLSVHDYGVDVTVDFGVNQQFDSINGQTLENVIANGGIDGITYNLNGKHLVFLREDNFPVGSSPENSGWNDYPSLFDEDVFDSYTYDQMDVVPGYFEKLNGSSTQNKRAGVWKVVISSTNVVTLEFLQEIDFFSVIEITAGVSNANKLVYYDPDIKQGFAAPSYTEVPQNAENYSRTVFDGNSTRFNSYRDVYSIPDENDKYLKFPKSGVFA